MLKNLKSFVSSLIQVASATEQKNLGNEFFKQKELGKAKSHYAWVFPYTKAIIGGEAGSGLATSDGMQQMAMKMAKGGSANDT